MKKDFKLYMVILVLLLSLMGTVQGYRPSVYPAYCSESGSDDEVNSTSRQIPALSSSEAGRVKKLKQVHVMIRHGARTPYDALQCWKDYNVKWDDCNVTQLVLPSETDSGTIPEAPWLFRKLYDASPDKLHGDCYTGQLIGEGYRQENRLGAQFQDRYVGVDDEDAGLFRLYTDNKWEDLDLTKIYFRSTDLQRTLMSGQQFAYNFFDVTDPTIVDWHTGDSSLDPLAPGKGSCPYLEEIENRAFADSTFVATNKSQAEALAPDLNAELGKGMWRWSSMTDCFMTAVCTERDIPDSAGKMDDTLFDQSMYVHSLSPPPQLPPPLSLSIPLFFKITSPRALSPTPPTDLILSVFYTIQHAHTQTYRQQSQFDYFFKMGWNHSEWAKLGMSDTLYKIRTNAQKLMDGDDDALKFVLLSAHDTSVIPYVDALLGSNGPKV